MPDAKAVAASEAPAAIQALVEKFTEHSDTYHRAGYNESQLRGDFLDPFFIALGWDVYNAKGDHEAYRDVILEQALRVETSVRAPDYCFRIGGTPKFFVEAKKPAVDIKSDVSPAFQLRRYAWTAKLPLSILTDFEELAVYDCRVKPDKDDKASKARVMFFKYTEFVERWKEIAEVFSYDAIRKGSFDKYAESTKKKRGTAEVDAAFLEEIESWREALARNIALRNEVTDRELNYAVQMIIDRIIFLRMCEGRNIEPYARLQSLANGPGVYGRLVELFHRADEKYNSGLFHFTKEKGRDEPPDHFTISLAIDDKVLKDIIRRLYYPESPYEFAALPADILGQVYEQFLGKVIVRSGRTRVRVEEKPEVKKAGGVYYTPTYIVDYIVENTVGKLLEGKTPQEVGGLTPTWKPAKKERPLSVLDPACGSGSFLIVAYQYLLDWYLRQYIEVDKAENHSRGKAPRIYQTHKGDWRLTGAERKRILLSHIYGVDIDFQAVEVTKLSLLLKVLEGETEESLQRQARLFHKERALPDLSNNIKCGNSLISSDFYQGAQGALFSEDDKLQINCFDWDDEFQRILQGGASGFDVVLGNPPYLRMETFVPVKAYLAGNYEVHADRADIFAYFIEREHKLLRPLGRFGMIVSNKFLRARYGKNLRDFISTHATVDKIIDFAGLPVFPAATVRTLILVTSKASGGKDFIYSPSPPPDDFLLLSSGSITVSDIEKRFAYTLEQKALRDDRWFFSQPGRAKLLNRLKDQHGSIGDKEDIVVGLGIKSGLMDAFVIDKGQRKNLIKANPAAKEILHPYLLGRDVSKYRVQNEDRYLIYTPRGIDMDAYPAVLEHLSMFREKLSARAGTQKWYELQQSQIGFKKCFDGPKIVYPDMAPKCRFAMDTKARYGANTTFFIAGERWELLAILNSRLSEFIFKEICAALEGPTEAYLRFFVQYVQMFPLPEVPKDTARQLTSFAREATDLQEALFQSRLSTEGAALTRRYKATSRAIDQLVYELYGLTDEEVSIIEEATCSDDS